MKAIDEIKRLIDKLADGTLPPDEPLFVLRAQDITASRYVRSWALLAKSIGSPAAKIDESVALAEQMDAWPVKQIPGKPETRIVIHTHELKGQ